MKTLFPFAVVGVLTMAACEDAARPVAVEQGPELAVTGTDGSTRCVGTVQPGTFQDVVVPPGATCVLNNSIVQNNVTALERSRLFMSNTRVGGNVDAQKARVVQVDGGTVGGNIQIREGSSSTEGSGVRATKLPGGNIQLEKNTAPRLWIENVTLDNGSITVVENRVSESLSIRDNKVANNLRVLRNRGAGSKVVQGNVVGDNLRCRENAPPFVGGPNDAAEAEGQCF
jgi:hypothetical protein